MNALNSQHKTEDRHTREGGSFSFENSKKMMTLWEDEKEKINSTKNEKRTKL